MSGQLVFSISDGRVRVGFNPDEEIGLGAHKFDVEKFACDWAYTMDGGEIGELEFENFNAAVARLEVTGVSVHPGYAKGKMINAARVATEVTTKALSPRRPSAASWRPGESKPPSSRRKTAGLPISSPRRKKTNSSTAFNIFPMASAWALNLAAH